MKKGRYKVGDIISWDYHYGDNRNKKDYKKKHREYDRIENIKIEFIDKQKHKVYYKFRCHNIWEEEHKIITKVGEDHD